MDKGGRERAGHPNLTACAWLCLATLAVVNVFPGAVLALDGSKGGNAVDHARAHAYSIGEGVKVGVIDGGGFTAAENGINMSKYHFAGRLIEQFDFNGVDLAITSDPPTATGSDDHATLVADIIASDDPLHTGVAPGSLIYVASGGNARTKLVGGIDWLAREHDVHIFNMSIGHASEQPAWDLDWLATNRDALHIIASGNYARSNIPIRGHALAYNALTVGGVWWDYATRWSYSSFETQNTGRNKPDLVAPTPIANAPLGEPRLVGTGTSFAAPHVTGVAALLASKGLTMGTGEPRNRLAQRAIIMNSTRKRFINGPDDEFADVRDLSITINALNNGTPTTDDGDYLDGGAVRLNSSSSTGPATDQWTPSAWSTDSTGKLTVTAPLDDEVGTGMLDAQRALFQYYGGHYEHDGLNPGGVGGIGWHRGTLTADATPDAFTFAHGLVPGSFITMTLVWEIETIEQNDPEGTVGVADQQDTFIWGDLPNFDLMIYKGDTLVAESIGTLDTVEHLHLPVTGDGLDYSIVVDLLGTGTEDVNYALAWWASPLLTGDLNGDGFVGQDDLNIILSYWGQSVTAGDPLVGDPSGDGFVGQDDLNDVLAGWGQGTPPSILIPEPTSLAMLILGVRLTRFRR